VATARRFAEELTRWFPGHADYLDSALAAWMVKRRHGGKPVVLRRQIA
jgi:hemerythrin